MASDESMTIRSFISMQEDDLLEADADVEFDDPHHLLHQNPNQNFSRLSICTSSSIYGPDDDDDNDGDIDIDMGPYMSRLSIESFDGDVEDGFSDIGNKPLPLPMNKGLLSSDSDKDASPAGCYSLPATPPRRRTRGPTTPIPAVVLGYKECASETEAADDMKSSRRRRRMRMRRRIMRERLLRDSVFWEMKDYLVDSHSRMVSSDDHQPIEEPQEPLPVLITRPKGGQRSLRMDLDEVKACKELGFELELDTVVPSNIIIPSTFDTASSTSGGNSPSWRISSPGDDPRDVKARLKVWAQAVALASTSRHATS
ncbi:uncharacterized protein LOC133033312 [Cannabis sativa]|uniref:Fold protein n=1 Tax=Cannabis sativa TaxID=3483 RepID=A0A7J6FKE2_CANSA|nr:uncharacterized protein LOC115714920 [Cannabis sativa]XP_060964022.1 uncharacterized protein LOC133033312 [Cannabis sativa]KAF4370220.1 hypothetical protein F8388_007361 [Cannabis sativa]